MTDCKIIEKQTLTNFTDEAIGIITDRMKEASDRLYSTSKEKYERKAKLIEEAADMTTKEKLDAIDQNYDRHTQEVWQGILVFTTASFMLVGFITGNMMLVKNARRLAA